MTLREIAKLDLFSQDTKIYMSKVYGCTGCLLDFDNKVNIGNLETSINEYHLNKEVSFIDTMQNTIVVHFKGE